MDVIGHNDITAYRNSKFLVGAFSKPDKTVVKESGGQNRPTPVRAARNEIERVSDVQSIEPLRRAGKFRHAAIVDVAL